MLANTHATAKASVTQTSSSKSSNRKDEANNSKKSDEEKRRNIKNIIDKIPTEKNALFNYPLDKTEIDSTIEKKIRPWINKKIIEYIGEPEPTLVDFICSKVLAGSTPQGILDDVQMVRLIKLQIYTRISHKILFLTGIRRGSGSICR